MHSSNTIGAEASELIGNKRTRKWRNTKRLPQGGFRVDIQNFTEACIYCYDNNKAPKRVSVAIDNPKGRFYMIDPSKPWRSAGTYTHRRLWPKENVYVENVVKKWESHERPATIIKFFGKQHA